MVIDMGNRIGDPSSNPGQGWFILLFTNAWKKGMDLSILPPGTGK